MTTRLLKRIERETFSILRSRRVIVVGLLPGDLLEFREKGRRKRYLLPVAAAMWTAIKAEVALEKRLKAEARKAKAPAARRKR